MNSIPTAILSRWYSTWWVFTLSNDDNILSSFDMDATSNEWWYSTWWVFTLSNDDNILSDMDATSNEWWYSTWWVFTLSNDDVLS